MKYQIPFKVVSEWIKRITNSWTETTTIGIAQSPLGDVEHHIIPANKNEDISIRPDNISIRDISGDDYCSTY